MLVEHELFKMKAISKGYFSFDGHVPSFFFFGKLFGANFLSGSKTGNLVLN